MWFISLLVGAGVLLTSIVLAIPIFALWTYHKRQLEQIRALRGAAIAEETRRAIEEIKGEVRSLRDMTTEYDMSFDTALQRLERRVEHLEREKRPAAAEPLVGLIEQG